MGPKCLKTLIIAAESVVQLLFDYVCDKTLFYQFNTDVLLAIDDQSKSFYVFFNNA